MRSANSCSRVAFSCTILALTGCADSTRTSFQTFGDCFAASPVAVLSDTQDRDRSHAPDARAPDAGSDACLPFYVNIAGPDDVAPRQTCTWRSYVGIPLYSRPPYEYEWRWNGIVVGHDSLYSGSSGTESFNVLALTVWDAVGLESHTGIEVLVDDLTSQPC